MNCPDVRKRLYDLHFGLLDGAERRAVEEHLASCAACRAAREAAEREIGLLERWRAPAPPPGLAQAAVDAARTKAPEAPAMTIPPIEPDVRWLRPAALWRAAAVVALAVAAGFLIGWHRIDRLRATPQEAFLYAQPELTPGLPGACRVFVRNALNHKPVAQADVRVRLVDNDGRAVWTGKAATDPNGIAEVQPDLPADLAEGQYSIQVDASSAAGQSEITQKVTVRRSFRVMVTTDKPLYQPGQVMHIRALALATADRRPVGGRDLVIEVQDAKGNKVFKKRGATSDFGIASADFALADQVNTGSYTITATVGDTASDRTVEVKRYRLPKFKVALTTDRGYYLPGTTLLGGLTARYTFGKPVARGRVRVVASEFVEKMRPFATAEGTTDDEGRFDFEIPLKTAFVGQELKKGDAYVALEATVTDPADHAQKATLSLTVTAQPIRIELFPESGTLVQNVENVLYVVTAYADGRPAKTTLAIGATQRRIETSDLGIAQVKITPKQKRLQLTVAAEDAQGEKATVTRQLRVGGRSQTVLLRTDRAVYRAGETAQISVLSADRVGRLFLDVVKDRRTMLTKSLDVQDGRGALALDLPPDLFGTLELHVYRIMADGAMVRDARLIQVSRADDLKIEARLDKETYRPAEKALLDLIVTRSDGEPAQAALSLAGVDEAVFALADMRPGLERIYFAIQEEILKPRYEIHARAPISPTQAIEPAPEPELEEATVVLFSAAEGAAPPAVEAAERFPDRAKRIASEKKEGFENLRDAAALLPYAAFVLLVVALVAYAAFRFWRRDALETAPEADVRRVRRATLGSTLCWIFGFYLPPVAAIVAAVLADRMRLYRHDEVVATLAAGAVAVAALALLVYFARRLRTCPAAAAAPLLRRLAPCVPLAYLCAVAALVSLAAFSDPRAGFVRDETVFFLVLGMAFAAAVTTGALSIAGHCAVRAVSTARYVWLGASRTVFAAAPALLCVPMMMLGGGMAAPQAMRGELFDAAGAEATPLRMWFTEEAVVPSEAPTTGEPAGPAGTPPPARVRRFFPETLLWRPEIITDEAGRARLEVPLADSITTWRLAMSAVSKRGELGAATHPLLVFQDFFVDIDFPVALTQHDVVSVPVAVYNYLDEAQEVRLEVAEAPWFTLKDSPAKTLRIGPKQVTSVSFVLEAATPGRHALLVRARGTRMADAVERKVIVEPDGKPVVQTVNGRLNENLSRTIEIPADAIDGASDLLVKVYPGSFSQVIEGLDSIFRMPYGCFEQTSSVTYPNVLVLDYLRSTKQAKPEIEMKALNFINLGYQRLVSYEVPGGGFSWFGRAPAHNVLTAYGLMEFCDMAKVCEIDPDVIERTRRWLAGQQQPDGSWKPTEGGIAEGAINAYQGQVLRTTAYIAWALAQAGDDDSSLGKALDYIVQHGPSSDDAYTLALCANALAAAKRSEATTFLQRLDGLKTLEDKLVHWASSGQGATYSSGSVLDIETTANAAFAFLQARFRPDTAHKALAWLIEHKDSSGTWHSTQATVAAMRALLSGTGSTGTTEGDTHVTIAANGKLAKELTITPGTSDVFRLISLRDMVREGTNTVALETAGDGSLAYQIVATHYVPWTTKPAEEKKELAIDVAYDTTTLKKDDVLTCRVTVTYNRPGTANMTIVDLGIPPGFQVLAEDFDALKAQRVIERYSLTGRQAILYFSTLPGGKPVAFTYRLRARFPVKAKTPRSLVYQYYEPDVRDEAAPVELRVM